MRAISQCSAVRGWWLLPPLLALALAMPADAQDTLALHVGDVVRVQLRGHPSPSYEGRLLAFDRDSLAIAAVANSNATVSIRRSDISRVLMSDGRSRSTWAGLGLGLLTGAALGAAAGAIVPHDCGEDDPFCGRDARALAGAAVGGTLGLVVGGIAGTLTWHERWRPVELPPAVGIRVVPTGRGRVGLALSITG